MHVESLTLTPSHVMALTQPYVFCGHFDIRGVLPQHVDRSAHAKFLNKSCFVALLHNTTKHLHPWGSCTVA
jgi:hypothetical protein